MARSRLKNQLLTKVSVSIAPDAEEAVMELLVTIFGQPASVYTRAESGKTTASVYLPSRAEWSRAKQRALRSGLRRLAHCGVDLGAGRIATATVRREDWAESWKRHFRAMEIGPSLLIKPSWVRRRPKIGQVAVVLDPGLSFGTGQHPTTAFCLRQLAARRRREALQSFLDVGTGSGILAIAAAKLGYRPVDAFDFDPDAVRIARENAKKNAVDTKLRITRKDLTRLPVRSRQKYDLICANLVADLLVSERARLRHRLRPGGVLILAGLLRSDFPVVRSVYERAGMRLVAEAGEGEWKSGAFVAQEGA